MTHLTNTNLKHKYYLLIGVFLILLLVLTAATAENGANQTTLLCNQYDCPYTSLFTAPNASAKVVGYYYNGVEVTILSKPNEDWVYVSIGKNNEQNGYISSRHLETETKTDSNELPRYHSLSTSLNLSSETNLSSSVALDLESEIILLGYGNDWWHVQVGNQSGFINSFPNFLTQVSGTYYDGLPVAYVCNPDPTDRLHLREKPSISSRSLGKYYNGAIVAILSKEEKGWCRVRIGNLEGYMTSRYLSEDFSTYSTAMPVCKIDNKSGTGLNMRINQSKSSASLGLFRNGTSVTILGLTENWCHVQSNHQIGFMLLSGFGNQISYDKHTNSVSSTRKTAEITATCSLYRSKTPDDDDVLTTLEPGDLVVVLENSSPWCKVRYQDIDGYVDSSRLRIK